MDAAQCHRAVTRKCSDDWFCLCCWLSHLSVHTVRGKTTHLARVCHHSGPVAYTQSRTHSKVNLSITGSAAVGSEILLELVHTFQVRNPESVGRIRFRVAWSACWGCGGQISSVLIEVYVCMSEIRAELASRSETYISSTGVVSGSSLR